MRQLWTGALLLVGATLWDPDLPSLQAADVGPMPATGKHLMSDRPAGSTGAAGRERRVLRVCPRGGAQPDCQYASLQAALAAALAGDQVVLVPGVYEEGAIITTPDLVLRGEPGAHLRGHAVEGKAALVVKAAGVTVEGIECSGIAVRDNNGACIRIEGDDLTVRNVHFHDNQQGILSGPGGGMLLVEGSLLERNGFGGKAFRRPRRRPHRRVGSPDLADTGLARFAWR
jgi:hypothetical protein